MALSVGSGEYKQKLIKILVFVPSGSIVGFTRSARASAGANKNRHLKTFRTRKSTARLKGSFSPQKNFQPQKNPREILQSSPAAGIRWLPLRTAPTLSLFLQEVPDNVVIG